MHYENIINAINSNVWHILPEKMEVILAYMRARITNANFPPVVIEDKAASKFKNVGGDIAVMQLYGTIAQRMNMMEAASGGTSTEAFGAAFDELAGNQSIKAIVLDIDSPGGSAYGLEELSTKIREARSPGRPIIAVANSLMASAAYYIGSAADEIVATPGAQVGSIGTILVHADFSQAYEKEGVRVSIIRTPESKGEANPYEPLNEGDREALQSTVDQYYEMFINAVAANRGLTSAKVKSDYGKGRLLTAKDALAAGMVDRIAPFDAVVSRLRGGSATGKVNRRARAEARLRLLKLR